MPTANIVEIEEDKDVVCPICKALIIGEEGLTEQPSCAHVRFVYANAEAFEYDAEGFEGRLDAEQEKADEDGLYFDPWDSLLSYCHKGDVILEQNSEGMACGPICFKVWIGIRGDAGESKSGRKDAEENECWGEDRRIFFHPTVQFVRWIKAHHGNKHIYDIGAGLGQVSNVLAKAGLHVTAIDLEPRTESEFDVIKADSTTHPFERDSVVIFCRPCHNDSFVRNTILRALNSGVRDIIYIGLDRNVRHDLGGYYTQFTKRRIKGIGHADERIWEMKIDRLRADAYLRRGAIPPLTPSFSQ